MKTSLTFLLLAAVPAFCQMTPDQKAADFSQLAATYALNYGPLQWKTQIFNYDLRDISSWLAKATQTQDDLDFYELCASYVASLNDAHDRFVLPSDFFASLGFSADIYDGKVIIDSVGQSLARSAFGVRVGDELVSIDGTKVSDLMQSLSRYSVAANSRSTQRLAADYLTYRDQSIMPHAHQVPDTSAVVVNRDGNAQTISIAWAKTGTPITTVGPVIPLHSSASARSTPAPANRTDPLRPLRNMRLPDRNFIAGFGQTAPVFQLPPNFLLRMGAARFDFFYSGTFQAGGFNIGYLRIPTFEYLPDDILQAEIDYMQQSTDGLIVDVMRNPGGDGCAAEDLASRLIPSPFTGIGLDVRATWFWVEAYAQAVQDAAFFGAPADVIAQYQALLDEVTSAYMTSSGIAGPLPICQSSMNLQPAADPKRGVIAYTKPVMLLVDEFSASAAELFAADMQDNQHAVLFGMRTMGAGGNVDQFPVTTYSYGTATITESLMHRLNPVVTPDYPTAPYVENIGVRPDVVMDYMTVDNLANHGATFVKAFTDAMVRYLSTGTVQ